MLKKNLFYNGLLSLSQFIFPLVTFPYSSRMLGPGGIGAVNFIDSFTQYFILFAALGIPLYGVREISKHRHDKRQLDKIFSEIFLIHLISSGIFSLLYFIMAFCTPQLNQHKDMVIVGIVMVVFNVLSAEWLFQGLEQFAYITFRSLVVRCLSVVLLFVLLGRNSPPAVYYGVMASGLVINGITNLFFLRKRVKIDFSNVELKKHLKPLLIILGSTLAVSVYMLMDNVLLGFMKGDEAVGMYATALRIVRLPLAIVGAVNAVIIPRISRAFDQRDSYEVNALIDKSFSLICLVGLPIATGMLVVSSFLIRAFAGPQFEPAVFVLELLAPLVVINGLGNIICLQVLAPMGKEKYLLKAYLISMVFSLLVNILLIRNFSYKGAAVGMLLTEIFATALCYYFLTKVIELKINKKVFIQVAFGCAAFFVIAYAVRLTDMNFFVGELLIIFLCILCYTLYIGYFVKNVYVENFKNTIQIKLTSMFRQ